MTPSEFAEVVKSTKEKLQAVTETPVSQSSINYGEKLQVTKGGDKVTLCLYNGKKGLKMVWGGKASPLLTACQNAAENAGGVPAKTVSLLADVPGFDGLWAGSDESGKGDYFGPLVVAAVCLTEKTGERFLKDGVMDSKALTDGKIHELAKEIKKAAESFSVLILKEPFYNQRYATIKAQKGNLNHLLSSGHVHALDKVLTEVPACHFALVDQFSRRNTIPQQLEAKHPGLRVYETPGGERDMAVAAASVLARDAFVAVMEDFSKQAGFPLPKGGGPQATAAAKRIVEEKGRDALEHFVKLHFANTKNL